MATETTPAKTETTPEAPKAGMNGKKILMWVISLVALAIVIYVISRAWKKGQTA
jgi:hypothetical protein